MKVSSVSVSDMVGRYVANENGAEFKVIDVRYDIAEDGFTVWLAECDEHGEDSGEEETGVTSLAGWSLL